MPSRRRAAPTSHGRPCGWSRGETGRRMPSRRRSRSPEHASSHERAPTDNDAAEPAAADGRPEHVALPRDLDPANNPAVPLIISPYGRGITGRANLNFWGDLPARGRFAVISPEGTGGCCRSTRGAGAADRRSREHAVRRQGNAAVASDQASQRLCGGRQHGRPEDALLVLLQHPSRRAPPHSPLSPRVPHFAPHNPFLQSCSVRSGRSESCRRLRAPQSDQLRAIAFSRLPLQMFWSTADEVVLDQRTTRPRSSNRIKELNPAAAVTGVAGSWSHSAGMAVNLPRALQHFGLPPPGL